MLLDRLLKLPPRTSRSIRQRDVECAMRDGVSLLCDVYLPAKPSGEPTVLLRSPYGRHGVFALLAQAFAHRGYITVIQSCRGTFGSGGTFNPFFQEAADGIDTVEWIERQPWFSGKLGLHGGSYMGQVQWAIAAELGERVSAMSSVVTTSDFQEAIHDGGGFRLQDLLFWARQLDQQESGHGLRNALKQRLFGDPLDRIYHELPVHELDVRALGKRVDFWREWSTRHPHDTFWEPIRFTKTIERIKTRSAWSPAGPIFSSATRCAISDSCKRRETRRALALARERIPARGCSAKACAMRWSGSTSISKAKKPARMQDLDRVKLWVNGPNEWREESRWPPRNSRTTRLALSADGRLTGDTVASGVRSFTYDPSDPTPSLAGPTLANRKGRGDVRSLSTRNDVLTFDGPVLDRPIEIIGDVSVTLTTSASRSHHDLFACLCDVDPHGRTINITDSYIRLRAPSSAETNQRITTLKAAPVAWRVPRGHRLRLVIAGGAFPRFARSLGVDEVNGNGVALIPVEITLHCESAQSCTLAFSTSP